MRGTGSEEDRSKLIALACDGAAACCVTRRAIAVALLLDGWTYQAVANAFFLDDDTTRSWHKLFEQRGIAGITSFAEGDSASDLTTKQEDDMKVFPRTPL
jgi:transposase